MFLDNLNKELTNLAVRYDNFILLRDFNLTVRNKNLNSFMNVFYLENLIKTSTRFESINPACIDLIFTNEFFKKSCPVKVGIFDHHHVVASKTELYSRQKRSMLLF